MDRPTYKYHIRDIVQCGRLGKGDFRIIDRRAAAGTFEYRLQSVDGKGNAEWMFEAHCSCDMRTRKRNVFMRNNGSYEEAQKILNKPQVKR